MSIARTTIEPEVLKKILLLPVDAVIDEEDALRVWLCDKFGVHVRPVCGRKVPHKEGRRCAHGAGMGTDHKEYGPCRHHDTARERDRLFKAFILSGDESPDNPFREYVDRAKRVLVHTDLRTPKPELLARYVTLEMKKDALWEILASDDVEARCRAIDAVNADIDAIAHLKYRMHKMEILGNSVTKDQFDLLLMEMRRVRKSVV